MGLRSSVRVKRLWNVLKMTLVLMAKKGLISKRRFIMDMNLMVKRGKLFRKSITNYFVFHQSGFGDTTRGGFGIQDYYEFSCSNTPINPVFSYGSKLGAKSQACYFPCINLPVEMKTKHEEEEDDSDSENVIKYSKYNALSPAIDGGGPVASPVDVWVSNYSSEEENEIVSSERGQVDNQAEEFIRRFYEQLTMQRRMQRLEYS